MTAASPLPGEDTAIEVAALIEVLHATDRRLEELLGGEVDSVSDLNGRTILLQRAQGHVRDSDAAKQAAILSALPAHIALLDHRGVISAVNEAWRRFAVVNVLQAPGHRIGVNYLEVCDSASGGNSADAARVALGIRAVLAGVTKSFSLEYPCPSPDEERWFQLTVTPLSDDAAQGAVVMHVNVSERRRAANTLAQLSTSTGRRERMLSTMLSSISDFVYLFDRNGRFQFANQKLLDRWGITLEQALGKNFREIGYPAELSARMQSQVQSVFDTGKSVTDDTFYLSPTGQQGYYEYIYSAALSADGTVDFVVGVTRDVSERKRTEEALRTSEAELRTLAECMPQMVWITRADGWCVYFNQGWMEYTGLLLEESVGHAWLKTFHPEDQQRVWAAWQHATTSHGTYEIESRLRRADGDYRWWLMRGVPLLNADGTILKWVGTCTDVHDLKQAELRLSDANKALSESERRFRDLLLAVQLLSMMLDRDGRITFCNDYLLRLTGWHRDEVIGQNWFELFQPHARGSAENGFEAILATAPGSWDDENEIVTRTGELRLIRWSNSILRSSIGEVIGTASIGEDVTERRRDRAALRELNADLEDRVQARTAQLNLARQEADQANHAKSAFLAAMSHEIRTPMNGVMGMIEVLQQTSLRGQQLEMVSLIQDSAKSLLGIIDDILDFSKIEAGMLDIVAEPMQLGETVERGCGMLAPVALKQGVRVAMFVDPAIPHIVLGDEGRFRQVLLNLLGNAIKFSGGRETMGQVSVRALLADRQPTDVAVNLIVADNGIGMDEETLIRVFTPFSQADVSTTRRFGGTGLGLPISDMLVRLMEGQIAVQSAPGVGTTFTVHMRFPTPAVQIDAADGADVEGLSCCLVGGDTQLADDLGTYLRHAGAIVTAVSDLAQATAASRAAGLTLWLLLPGQHVPPLAELRAMTSGHASTEVRFVILGHDAGGEPRLEARDLVTLEANLLAPRPLFRALSLAAGRTRQMPEAEAHDRNDASVSAPGYYEAKLQGRLILVAEDNETNRKVILHQLHLVGLAAEVCRNGREALERWRSGDFALVLTDLNMPEMDGYELAAAIRAEQGARRHTPIIALTANALREEELRCRAAGMDAYLTKPVRLPQLKAAIEAWLAPAQTSDQSSPATAPPAVDLRVLEEYVGTDPALVAEVLRAFGQSATDASVELNQAFADNSMQAVVDAAHRLKAAARSIGGNRLGQLCADIEGAAFTRHEADLNALIPRFRSELEAVQAFLAAR